MTRDEGSQLRSLIQSAVQRSIELERASVAKEVADMKVESYLYKLEHPENKAGLGVDKP